jgi:acetyl esterase/lipase
MDSDSRSSPEIQAPVDASTTSSEAVKNRDTVSPVLASNNELQGLPSAVVIRAENDQRSDEREAYALKLREAGVAVTATRYYGMIHDFLLFSAIHKVLIRSRAASLSPTAVSFLRGHGEHQILHKE